MPSFSQNKFLLIKKLPKMGIVDQCTIINLCYLSYNFGIFEYSNYTAFNNTAIC